MIGSPPTIDNAPGLTWRAHKTGWVARWACRSDIAKKGYKTKSMRLWFGAVPSVDDIAWIQSRCNALQSEMLVWGRGGIPVIGNFDGTIASLINCYQTDADSPFRKLRYHTRVYYDVLCRKIEGEFGDKQVGKISARDVRHWHEDMVQAGKVSMAHSVVGMLRTIINFGASILEHPECAVFSGKLRLMRFQMGKPRVEALSAEQAITIRRLAHEAGRPSIALAQAAQFEFTFRQKDCIGEWVPISEPGLSDVMWGNAKWLRGIRWEEIDASLKLKHVTSKRQKEITVDLNHAPMVLEELDLAFPGWDRDRTKLPAKGPVIVCEARGVPWDANEFRRYWRMIATKGGIPKTVRNMDTRSGAITEALGAGASLDSVRKAATHSDVAMTQKYSRGDEEATADTMRLRVVSRNKTGS